MSVTQRLFSWSFRQLWMHNKGRASIESGFSLLSLIFFLIQEEVWEPLGEKPRCWCFTCPKVSFIHGRLNDGHQNECDFKRKKKEPRCFLCWEDEGHGKTMRRDMLIFYRDCPPAALFAPMKTEWAEMNRSEPIRAIRPLVWSLFPRKLASCPSAEI